MRRWFFGGDTFAHPWLRWVCTPLFRIGATLVGLPIVVTGHSTWVSAVGVACLAMSVAAGVYDTVVLWRRRRVSL